MHPLGQPEHVDRAVHAGLGRLHGIVLIVDRRRRAREIVDLVDLDVERKGDVVAHEFEIGVTEQVRRCCARVPVKKLSTHRTSLPAASSRSHKMRAQKAGATGDQNPVGFQSAPRHLFHTTRNASLTFGHARASKSSVGSTARALD